MRVGSVSQFRQFGHEIGRDVNIHWAIAKRTKPSYTATNPENLVKIGRVNLEIDH